MSLKDRIYSVLIVSSSDIFNKATTELLPPTQYEPVCKATSINEAKRFITAREFDFIIVNSPLPDDDGIRFAADLCMTQTAVVLLLIRAELYNEVCDKVTEYGVFTLRKPPSRSTMLQALSWMATSRERTRIMEQKASVIEEQIEGIRLINRAKCLLISELRMTESEAHHYIEKSAMNKCITKENAAENIIKSYK